jgi:RNA polymerase sigma-70 factor (ECF subfamily)
MGEQRGPDKDLEISNRLRLAASGDGAAWAELLEPHRDRLRRIVSLRMDRRLSGRLSPSDVIQEASIAAVRLLPKYVEELELDFFLWLRWLTGKTLQALHRKHLGVQSREAGREVPLLGGTMPDATSAAIAAQLLASDTRPSVAAARAERKQRLEEALEGLAPVDREILALRHFEELTAEESARVLGIERSAASKRYIRALERLKRRLEEMPGGAVGFSL